MMKSMTAYASSRVEEGDLDISVEIRTYNSRYLDVVLRLPSICQPFEEKVKKRITEKISRGRVEIRLQMENISAEYARFEIDRPKAESYFQALAELKDILGIQEQITLNHFGNIGGIIVPVEDTPENHREQIWFVVEKSISSALSDLESMREREGEYISRDLYTRLDVIENWLDEIEQMTGGRLEHYRDRLMERISELTEGIVEIDPVRIAQEAAMLADKSDISEEIVRARSHIQQFKSIMEQSEPAGRKLNFLVQEFNREFNTMGAKAGSADVSHNIVSVKSELEKIREQLQNIE